MFPWSQERAYERSQILAPMHVDSPLMWTFPNANLMLMTCMEYLSTRSGITIQDLIKVLVVNSHFIPEKFTNYENYASPSKKKKKKKTSHIKPTLC